MLQIELIPHTAWRESLYRTMPKDKWDGIRKKCYADYGYKCGICGAEGQLNCHEIWHYDGKRHIQELHGFIALCKMCHFVKHIGRAIQLANEGHLDYQKLIEHFMKVNDCDENTFYEHRKEAFAEWEDRSKCKWKIDLGKYKELISERR